MTGQARLLRLLQAGPAGAGLDGLRAGEWEALAAAASRHQLGAYVWRLLEDAGALAGAPAPVAARLRGVYLQSATRNALLLRDARRAAAMLATAGIRTMLLKGAHLARFTYGEPALRSMADLDLMVERDRLLEAEALFLEAGYGPRPRPDPEKFCEVSNHLPKLIKPDAAVVELHWTIERPTSPFPIDPAALWARARPAVLDGTDVWLLGLEDLLLHLVLHASYHHGFDRAALKGLVDLREVIAREGDAVDWAAFAARANAWGAGGFAWATLRLATDLAGARVPSAALDALDHGAGDARAVEDARRYVLMPASDLSGPLAEVATRRGGARWRFVFRRLFPERATLAAHYGVPAGSLRVWPLYLLRVGALLGQRGGLFLRALLPGASRTVAEERDRARRRIAAWAGPGDGEDGATSASPTAR